MRRHRPVAFILPAVAAVVLTACSRSAPEPEPIRAVRTVIVAMDSAVASREFAAELRARSEARLGFRVGGKLVARPAEVGQRVRAGQVLAQLDPEDLRQGQDAARAALRAAQANHEIAAAELERFKGLRDQGFISAAELDRRTLALTSAKAQLDQAQAQATVQRNQAAYATLLATGPGVVVATEAEPGQVVAAGAAVVRLALDGPRDAVFAVPEDSVAPMQALLGRPGALQVRLWSSGAVVPATLRELAAAADPVTRTFQAKADLGGAAVQLGQTATVLLRAAPAPGLVKLPLTAVTRVQDKTSVWVVDGAAMTVRPVTVDVAGAEDNTALIRAGLSAGQRVVTAGVHTLSPGQKVRLYGAAAAASAAAAAPAASR